MKFTPRVTSAFRLADTARHRLGHPCVGSQHLVLGLFLLGSGVHFSVGQKIGFTIESLGQSLLDIGPVSEETQTIDGLVFGASAGRALERAAREAAALSNTYIGTEHVLLGLLSEESGSAARLFAAHEIDTAKVRQMILDEYAQV